MIAIIDKWTPLKKTFRLWRRMSYLYIVIGIAILFIAADMTDMITAMIHCAFSFLFGALLGYISSAYDLRMCEKENFLGVRSIMLDYNRNFWHSPLMAHTLRIEESPVSSRRDH